MARRLSIAKAAAADLTAARRWLMQPGSGLRAWARLVMIEQSIRSLRSDPLRWPIADHPGYRECSVGGYRVIYKVEPDTGVTKTAGDVTVVRVFGPYQDRSEL